MAMMGKRWGDKRARRKGEEGIKEGGGDKGNREDRIEGKWRNGKSVESRVAGVENRYRVELKRGGGRGLRSRRRG